MNNKPFAEMQPQKKAPAPIAEVIESSLDQFLAQTWEWDTFPQFGSLVEVAGETETLFGIVTTVKTGSMDPQRYPFPYQKTEEELKKEQPQIFEFLKTTFVVKILGYQDTSGKNSYLLPSQPAKIHAFIRPCSREQTINFFNSPDFLYLLFSSSNPTPHLDDLLLAILKQLAAKKKLTPQKLDQFCQTLSLLTGNDYRRIKLVLKRAQFLI